MRGCSKLEYPWPAMAEAPFPVEYAVLGLLSLGPKHGYELKKEIENDLRPFWHIATSRLYLALARLENKGLISGEPQSHGGRARRVYYITEAGRRELLRWLHEPVRAFRDLRVEFLAKIYFLRKLDPSSIPDLARAQLDVLRGMREKLLVSQVAGDPLLECAREFRLGMVEAAIRWLEELPDRCLREVNP